MNAPRIKTPLPGPRAKALIERDRKVVSPSYTRGYPLVIERASGSVVEDVDGNLFLDCAAGIAVNATGHCHPDVVAAIGEQAQKFLHMSGTDFYYELQVRLAEELAAVAPVGPETASGSNDPVAKSFFGNSGTEAVEASLKLARYHTGRPNVIGFFGAFHGRTMGALAVTASKTVQRRGFGPFTPGIFHAPFADCYRCPLKLTPDSCAAECLDVVEHELLVHLVSPDEVAAVLVEPIQGEGGYIVAPDVFLARLRELTRQHGILLLVDEVQSGMGRTGKMFAIEHSGVRPDVIAAAKGIASGLPLGVCIARADLMTWPPGAHASTFGGNPLSCAAALATIDAIVDERMLENAIEVGDYAMDVLTGMQARHPTIGDVRGKGLMIGVEFVLDRQKKTIAHDHAENIVTKAFEKGALFLSCGKSSIRLSPALNISRQLMDEALSILEDSIMEAEAEL